MTNKLKIIKADEYVADLTPSSEQMLMAVIEFFALKNDVVLAETIHGHIATMHKKDGRFIPGTEGKPARLGIEEMAFFKDLYGFRWVEAATNQIQVGFTNKVTG